MKELFTLDKINAYTTRIKGMGGELCYLLEGRHRALLIDTLCGVGSLKAYVASLTKLPVQVALTHAHGDHCGGAWEYDSCYLHPDDLPLFYSAKQTSADNRFAFVSMSPLVQQGTVTREDVVPARPIKAYPIYEGDAFDLGGLEIQVLHVPGHSYGTLVFLDVGARIAYSGDACNIRTIIGHYGATTVEEYRDSLRHFKIHQGKFDVCYGGHGFYPVPNSVFDQAITLCEKILAGTDARIPARTAAVKRGFLAAQPAPLHKTIDGGDANILYQSDAIFPNPRPVICSAQDLCR